VPLDQGLEEEEVHDDTVEMLDEELTTKYLLTCITL